MAHFQSTEKDKCICIYCMGDYGLETYFKLRQYGVKINYFADRDPKKKGYALEGLYCRSYEELLCEDRENCMVIVAVKNPENLIRKFQQEEFQQVYDKETAIKMLVGEAETNIEAPLRDICRIEQMKDNIQKLVYYHDKSAHGEPKGVLLDYLLRHK